MTIDAARIAAALADTNLRAFLAVIRAGEGTADGDGYRRCYGGSLFDSFADHPRRAITAGRYTSTAAGAYQFLARTWDGLVAQYGFADFSPASQDAAAVALIAGRKALDDVLAGRIQVAIGKCNREWASLPGSPYGQPTRTLAQALATYAAAGGVLEPAAQASPDSPAPAPAPHSKEGFTMPPFLLAALPALIQAIPSLAQLFGGHAGGEIAHRELRLEDLYTGYRTNVMRPDELLAWIKVPRPVPPPIRIVNFNRRLEHVQCPSLPAGLI